MKRGGVISVENGSSVHFHYFWCIFTSQIPFKVCHTKVNTYLANLFEETCSSRWRQAYGYTFCTEIWQHFNTQWWKLWGVALYDMWHLDILEAGIAEHSVCLPMLFICYSCEWIEAHILITKNERSEKTTVVKTDPITSYCVSSWFSLCTGWKWFMFYQVPLYFPAGMGHRIHIYYTRGHFVYASSQWETMLPCNVVSHWLGAYTEWSLLYCMKV